MSILTVSAHAGRALHRAVAMAKPGVLANDNEASPSTWGPRGIRTCAIVARPLPTEGAWSRLMPKERGGDEELVKTIPLRRVGDTSSSRTLRPSS